MGLEFTRGNNARCPPFLVGGLMIMCLFLLCSWWSLSSQNFELLRQNDNLAEQLRINGEELRKCKDCQSQLTKQEVQIRQIKDLDQELQQLQLQCQKQKDLCETEMKSLKKLGESKEKNLESLRTNVLSLKEDLEKQKSRVHELENKLESMNEKKLEMEKAVLEKNKIQDSLKNNPSVKGTAHINGVNGPVLSAFKKSDKKMENLENKMDQNEAPVAPKPDNFESVGQQENIGGEVKNDDAGVEARDQREDEMMQTIDNTQ